MRWPRWRRYRTRREVARERATAYLVWAECVHEKDADATLAAAGYCSALDWVLKRQTNELYETPFL